MFSFTRTPLNAMRVRVCMSSRSHVMTPLPHSRALSSSSSSSSSTTAFAFQAVNTSRIKDATFSIEQGSKVCIIGSDEKAKFDVIRLINGAIEPTSGTVEKTSEKTHITYHPYVPKDCYGMTVEAYLTENLPDGATSHSNSKIQEALDDACIDKESRSDLISELSASEKARLQLAVALVQSPDILLLDNPTKTKNGVFSDNDIKKIIEFILKFPKTCVVNSSDADFLNSFSDNVLNVTEDGRVELFIGSYTSAQNTIDERSTGGEEKVTNSDVRFGLFLLFLLCPFEAMLFFYYQ